MEAVRTELTDQTHRYLSLYPGEANRIAPLLQQLKLALNILDRKTLPGHITASGIGIKDGKMLMIFHPFLKKWLQPGGHVDSGEIPLEAAKRELLEETGINSVAHLWHERHPIPFDIDIHFIPANPSKREPAHLHYDFRYLLCIDGTVNNMEKDHQSDWKEIQTLEEPNLKNLIVKLSDQSLLN